MWTPSELRSESHPAKGEAWRVVEAQHENSTRKLTRNSEEQQLLEELLEQSKPPYPPAAIALDYLLKSPFRYEPPWPHGSRFRRPYCQEGVFYCAEHISTALAEMAFYRLLFFSGSPETPLPDAATPLSVFSIAYKTSRMLNLTRPPLSADQQLWEEMQDYQQTQRLADQCRKAKIQIIRYLSIRDPKRGHNLAILHPGAFASPQPMCMQTWFLMIKPDEVDIYRTHSRSERFSFQRTLFTADPRLQTTTTKPLHETEVNLALTPLTD